jgi:hypothetical protein
MRSLAQLNSAIVSEFPGLDIELVKGSGYFYFSGEDGLRLSIPSIYVCHFNHMTGEQWAAVIDVVRAAIESE